MLSVMLAIRELGENYLMPEATVESLFEAILNTLTLVIGLVLFYVRKRIHAMLG